MLLRDINVIKEKIKDKLDQVNYDDIVFTGYVEQGSIFEICFDRKENFYILYSDYNNTVYMLSKDWRF